MGLAPWAAWLDVQVSLALSVSLTLPVDRLSYFLVVLLNVVQVILVVVAIVSRGASVTCHLAEELHLSSESLQLTPELLVLLLELSHSSAQRPAQVGCLLQTTLHAQLKSADIHVDLPDGVPESVLVPG